MAVATFFLLPTRPSLGERFSCYLQNLFPGLNWASNHWPDLADLLGTAVSNHPDIFVVFREEIPEGENPGQALIAGFGAEPGDEVVEIQPGKLSGEVSTNRWPIE